jgi:uncharacterized protein
MRILTVSDKVEPVLYGPYMKDRVGRVDLILACGDLPYYYLEYIVGLLDVPLYFVHGNHDKPTRPSYAEHAPLATTVLPLAWAHDMHMRTACHDGLLMAGLEGSREYNPGAPFQYTESAVRRQTLMLGVRLLVNKMRYGRYLDVLITHAPPRGIHDDEDLPHQGFQSYLTLLRRFGPSLMIHGHQHVYNRSAVTETDFDRTRIINTYGYRVMELERRADGAGWELTQCSR